VFERPETRYASVGDTQIAFQVVGDGSPDLLYCWGLGSHVELVWDFPWFADYISRLASFSRPIIFDRRGTGASDGVPYDVMPTWEEWAEDLGAILEAVDSADAVLVGALDAGPLAILYAALHPERVRALVLLATAARYLTADDYPMGLAAEEVDAFVGLVAASWGTPAFAFTVNPSRAEDDEEAGLVARNMRSSATPRAAAAQYGYLLRSLDVRQALPLIRVPTLVVHQRNSPLVPQRLGRYLAEEIKGAAFVELPDGDLGRPSGATLDAIEQFVTGECPRVAIDSVLTTVLFTDIVGSTELAASLGDRRWHTVLDSHDRIVRQQLRRFRGREIKSTGDGFMATFDGPARAIRCATAIVEATRPLGISVRTGLHTGECEVRGEDLGGLAVHIAARVGSQAGAEDVLVSGTVRDLVVGSDIRFEERGERRLKGVPGSWKLYAVEK
jgi:class 3 adenylate cyclase/pimeloyl-ACP methyl ester carboxylesterase